MAAPGSHRSNATSNRVQRLLARFVGVLWRGQTYRNLAYLVVAFPLGLAYFVMATVGVALGIGLVVLLVGVLILAFVFLFGLVLAGLERRLTNRLLGTTARGRTDWTGEARFATIKGVLLDRRTWSGLIYLPVKFIFGIVSLVVITTAFPTGIAMLLVPFYHDRPGLYVGVVSERAPEIHETIYLGWNYMIVGLEAAFTLGYWEINSLAAGLVVAAVGLVVLVGSFHVCNALAWTWGRYAQWSLDGCWDPVGLLIEIDQASDRDEPA